MARMLLGILASGCNAGATSRGRALVNLMMRVWNRVVSFKLVTEVLLNGAPALGAFASGSAFTNFVPCGIMVMPFMARIVSSAMIASVRVSSVWLRIVTLAAGRVAG